MQTNRSLFPYPIACLLLAAVVAFVGCSESPTEAPPVEVPFTLFGVVNPDADTQAVIVYPVRAGTLEPLEPEPLDATVRSTDVATGDVRVWRDSIMADGAGNFSHIFWSDFQAEFGHTYELEVVRSDGAESTVEVRVPERVSVTEQEVDEEGSFAVRFRNGRFRIVQVDVTYHLTLASVPASGCPDTDALFHYTFSYAGEEVPEDDGWTVPVDLTQYRQFMEALVVEDIGNDLIFDNRATRLGMVDLEVRFTIGDEAWELPRGFLDRRILSHPGTLTNVENGLGFVGAGYRDTTLVYPSNEAIEDAGFYDYMAGGDLCN